MVGGPALHPTWATSMSHWWYMYHWLRTTTLGHIAVQTSSFPPLFYTGEELRGRVTELNTGAFSAKECKLLACLPLHTPQSPSSWKPWETSSEEACVTLLLSASADQRTIVSDAHTVIGDSAPGLCIREPLFAGGPGFECTALFTKETALCAAESRSLGGVANT